MVDMFVFWLSYGTLSIFFWLGIVCLCIASIDWYISRITGGDVTDFLYGKFVVPLGNKLPKFLLNSKGKDCISPLAGVATLGFFANLWIQLCYFFYEDEKSLHEVTVWLSEFLVEYATLPILIVIGAILLDTTFRKAYKFGKKVLPLVDKINKGEK